MMKRTQTMLYHEHDLARSLSRRILGPQTDADEIYLRQTPRGDTENDHTVQGASSSTSQETSGETTIAAPDIPQTSLPTLAPGVTSSTSAKQIQDAELPVTRIVWAIVASKLKKETSEVPAEATISSLVGGRSTLTNEIVGDLHQEFKELLPDRAEDQSLEALCKALQAQHGGTLGKQTRSMINKMISSKFPSGFSQARIRQDLQDGWGLGPMRQEAVLLSGLTCQPPARLSSPSAAKEFLTMLASTYFREEGLTIPSQESSSPRTTMVDDKTLKAMNEKNSAVLRQVMEVLGAHLEEPEPSTIGRENCAEDGDAVKRLDVWLSEHGEEYAEGIMPRFDVHKQRQYDSYWNWNSQDIALLADLIRTSRHLEQPDVLGRLFLSITNRACDRSNAQIKNLIEQEHGSNKRGTEMRSILQLLHGSCIVAKDHDPIFIHVVADMAPVTTISASGYLVYREEPRRHKGLKGINGGYLPPRVSFPVSSYPHGTATVSYENSEAFARDLVLANQSGLSFSGRNVLLNGAGRNSIGINILRCLLTGGARVTLTTSSFSTETAKMYQRLYAQYGSKGSVLRVLPCNQGSQQDVMNLVQYLDADPDWDLDYIIPFAAVSENGRGLEGLDSRSELAHRLMLTNLLRLLGAVAASKRRRNVRTRPATVILPLSPNHGLMGNDGLYSESKLGLEALLPKWSSEGWAEYLSLLGVVIGWTRGTGLMDENDIVAQAVEGLGVRTFSSEEMAANITVLMGGSLNAECQMAPLLIDMGGGLGNVDGFKDKLAAIRRILHTDAEIKRAIEEERRLEMACVTGQTTEPGESEGSRLSHRANIKLPLLVLPDYNTEIKPLAEELEGMVDLSRVVVITGFAELGPHGSSRTRWEMEVNGTYSLEGCIEMAWTMGLIKHHSGVSRNGIKFSSWVDTKTLRPVDDAEIPGRYLSKILEHSGIRLIEPAICDNGYDPEKKESMQEVLLQYDLPAFEVPAETVEDLRRKHGDKITITFDESGACRVKLKAGAAVMIPRASRFDRTVAGQLPTGWSAKKYGISDDIIDQVDPVTLFSLVCTVEALLMSGVTDPYELYKYIHVSELGNCIGSSMGGLSSLRKMHRDRFIDKPVKGDILQETFINTTGAWINMLLTSSSGPIRTPVGACATALESLDTGCDLIIAKKAKVCLVGGVEDFVEDVSYEFGSMRATANTDAEFAAGRRPEDMSRPTASSRSGFMESQGCGIQVLTSAELALEMGLPIYGIVSYTNMSADKASRSVPAPGKGVLVNAREAVSTKLPPPLVSISARRKLLDLRKRQIRDWCEASIHDVLSEPHDELMFPATEDVERHRHDCIAALEEEAKSQVAEATFNLGNNFWKDSTKQQISPLRGSLATWGLGIDDITVASLHGTSTVQNDLNETFVIEEQMKHLGRRDGNLLSCVTQKWLTGHAKGAAGAWMVNGCLQMMDTALIPGNRNADNVDKELRSREHLLFPNVTMGTDGIKACSVTSFGFGQKGSQSLLVHPRYLFATISAERFQIYADKRQMRWKAATAAFVSGMINENMVSLAIKSGAPYAKDQEIQSLLDPNARF
ncbi:fatty acid synthase subunit alpha reductase, partial [Metarhizium majus ARSEF 297]